MTRIDMKLWWLAVLAIPGVLGACLMDNDFEESLPYESVAVTTSCAAWRTGFYRRADQYPRFYDTGAGQYESTAAWLWDPTNTTATANNSHVDDLVGTPGSTANHSWGQYQTCDYYGEAPSVPDRCVVTINPSTTSYSIAGSYMGNPWTAKPAVDFMADMTHNIFTGAARTRTSCTSSAQCSGKPCVYVPSTTSHSSSQVGYCQIGTDNPGCNLWYRSGGSPSGGGTGNNYYFWCNHRCGNLNPVNNADWDTSISTGHDTNGNGSPGGYVPAEAIAGGPPNTWFHLTSHPQANVQMGACYEFDAW